MLEILQTITQNFEFEAVIRLVLGAILTGIIGYEREACKKPAGMRTHVLVGESAVMIMLCGIFLSQNVDGADPSRIPAQLLSGIGFIGAGTILRDGFHVKGLTTAASLLAVTGIGLLVGSGAYIIGIIATAVVYIILSYSYKVSDTVEKYNEFSYKIYTDHVYDDMKKIEKILAKDEIRIKRIKAEADYIEVKGKLMETINQNKLVTSIMKIEGIKEIVEE